MRLKISIHFPLSKVIIIARNIQIKIINIIVKNIIINKVHTYAHAENRMVEEVFNLMSTGINLKVVFIIIILTYKNNGMYELFN